MSTTASSAVATSVARHFGHTAPEPWPGAVADGLAELHRRAVHRGDRGSAVAAELMAAGTERRRAARDARGCEAALRCGHHMASAARQMRAGWSADERAAARGIASQMLETAMHSPDRTVRAWAHFRTAHMLVDAGSPKDAWHHAQMAEFTADTPAAAAYFDQLHAALRERIRRSCNDPVWVAMQMFDD